MGRNGRRNRNRQQTQYQDEGTMAQQFFDSRRGLQRPSGSKQNYNPFQQYLRPPPPYETTNPHPNRNPFSKPIHNLHTNPPHSPPLPQGPNHADCKNRQRALKCYLIQTLNTAVRQINTYLPDNDTFSSSSDSEGEEEMDWQPEHEVIIPQPFEVVYPWPAGPDAKGCFERPAWGDGSCRDGRLCEDEERVRLKLQRGIWMANANGGFVGGGAATRRLRFEVGKKRDWEEESMPDSP